MGGDASAQRKLFQQFDSDGSGMIDKREIALYMKEHYRHFPLSAIELLINLADKDGNGEIDKKEFGEFYKIVQAAVTVSDHNLKNIIYIATSVAENSTFISGTRMEQVMKVFGGKKKYTHDSYNKAEFLEELGRFVPF
ncbi:calmodulin-A-like_isoform X2 [Hexamita inflata]|uniref:Calmodulin-A-like isoform X2 n=1 Tax=Hexamita inflata TaxID=28002 RepID=A0AA86R4W7_9EUKA|nr:calmodulin-A-like isoform X2 [Hexamita inflata]